MKSHQTLRDPLTGVYSRAALQERLQEEVGRAQRYDLPLAVVVLDLDHYKSINDGFGHTRGDKVLVQFATRVSAITRRSDPIFRYGGDEFVILFPHTDKIEGAVLAGRLLEEIRSKPFPGDPDLSITFSAGVASFPEDGQTPEALFEIADQRQYIAKRTGRSRVVIEDLPGKPTHPGETSRLIERDAALEILRQFLDSLAQNRWGVFEVNGTPQSGKSRFLAEVRKVARLQGYAVLALQGKPALRERVYGAVIESCRDLSGPALPTNDSSDLMLALQEKLVEKAEQGLLVTMDDLSYIDVDSLEFLRSLFLSSAFPRIALAYASEGEQESWLQEAPLRSRVNLEPLSETGLRVWIRHILQWEAPDSFLAWLHSETGGLPGAIQRGLAYLTENDILQQSGSNYLFRKDFASIPLAEELSRQYTIQPSNLPSYLTEFVGRETELGALKKLIWEQRVVAIVGSAGVGKTRLASQAAAEAAEVFSNRVCFISLASLASADYLVYSLSDALHFSLSGPKEPARQLFNYLSASPGETLLVLDGFEHLHGDTQFLEEMLEQAPGVRFLITSNERLGLPGSVTFELSGLAFPEDEQAGDVEKCESMQLFVRVARRSQPHFNLTEAERPYAARICRLVGGIPLLIELGAAWARAFSCQEIAASIERNLYFLTTEGSSLPDKSRSLTAVFDSLWELLSEHEQKVLCYLSVLRGGFSEEAARQIAGASPFFLDALLGKAYLRRAAPGKYMLHELLRQFVSDKLAAMPAEERAARQKHCTYYIDFVQKRSALLRGIRRMLVEISSEIQNIRAAWDWAVSNTELREIDHSLDGLTKFYDQIGWFQEAEAMLTTAVAQIKKKMNGQVRSEARTRSLLGRLLVDQAFFLDRQAKFVQCNEVARNALALVRPKHSDRFEASAHLMLGLGLWGQGNYEAARVELTQAMTLARQKHIGRVTTDALCALGEIYLSMGDHSGADLNYRQALQIYLSLGDRRGEGQARNFLGIIAKNRGQYQQALHHYEHALQIFREVGYRRGEAQALNNLGHVYTNLGDYKAARSYYEQALPILREIGDRSSESWGLNSIGYDLYLHGDYEQALAYFNQAQLLARQIGDPWNESISLYNLGTVFLTLGDFDAAGQYLGDALKMCQELGDKWGLVWRLSHMGLYCHLNGENENAIHYLLEAIRIGQEINYHSVLGKALTIYGHALAGLDRLEEAAAVYEQTLQLRQELNEIHLTIDPLAGLVEIATALHDGPRAAHLAQEILSIIDKYSFQGSEDPFRVYLACYRALNNAGDPCARDILETGYQLLIERANRISDDILKTSFLENIYTHKELVKIKAVISPVEHRP